MIELERSDVMMHDNIIDSYRDLMLSDNFLYIMKQTNQMPQHSYETRYSTLLWLVEAVDMSFVFNFFNNCHFFSRSCLVLSLSCHCLLLSSDRLLFAKVTQRAALLTAELGALVKTESVRHLQTIHDICEGTYVLILTINTLIH